MNSLLKFSNNMWLLQSHHLFVGKNPVIKRDHQWVYEEVGCCKKDYYQGVRVTDDVKQINVKTEQGMHVYVKLDLVTIVIQTL